MGISASFEMAGIGKVTLWWQTKRMSPDRRPGGFAIPQQKNKHTPLLRITNPQSLNRLGHFLTPDYKSGGTPSSMRVPSPPLPIRWWVTTGLATSILVSALREIIWAIIPATSMNMIIPNGTRRCFWKKKELYGMTKWSPKLYQNFSSLCARMMQAIWGYSFFSWFTESTLLRSIFWILSDECGHSE